MPIGIDPKVDYAFKLVFGSPDHTAITIHFLNAVLELPQPITWVEILNPIHGQDFSDDKLSVLDVLARDAEGRRYNIEMQTTLPPELVKRITFYNCGNYTRQLKSGEPYGQLRPAISICVLDGVLFPGVPEHHLSFCLRCDQHPELLFNSDLAFHLLELPKYHAAGNNRERWRPLDKWLYFLKNAEELEAEAIASQLADDEFREATGVLQMISETPEQRDYYESRRRILDSLEYQVAAARREGREEGMERGTIIGKIELLHELLGKTAPTKSELSQCSDDELTSRFADLQSQLRSRGGE